MTDIKNKVIRNTVNRECNNCGGIHDYVSRMPTTGYKDCSTPVAFSPDQARKLVGLLGANDDAIVDVPHDTFVVMDDSARKLPHGEPVMLSQLVERELLA